MTLSRIGTPADRAGVDQARRLSISGIGVGSVTPHFTNGNEFELSTFINNQTEHDATLDIEWSVDGQQFDETVGAVVPGKGPLDPVNSETFRSGATSASAGSHEACATAKNVEFSGRSNPGGTETHCNTIAVEQTDSVGEEITACSVEIQNDGTVFYSATVRADEQVQAEVEWFIDGQLAARDGPLFIGDFPSDFHQPREDGFTENQRIIYQTAQDVVDVLGAGTHDATAELTLV